MVEYCILNVRYSIERSHEEPKTFILWKCNESKRGINYTNIYSGTRKECKEKLKEIEKEGK